MTRHQSRIGNDLPQITPRKRKRIFIFSSVHPWNDGRIFFRQAKSLAKVYDIELHAVSDFGYREVDDIEVFGLPKWKNFSDRLKTLWILWKRICRSKVDAYHFHDPELLILVPLIKIFKRKPIIFDVHEHYLLFIMEKEYIPFYLRYPIRLAFASFERIMLTMINRAFYTTNKVGERYIKAKGRSAIQVNNLPSISLFNNEPVPYSERSKKIIFLGNMTAVRGIKEILQAFVLISKKYPNYELHLVGRFNPEEFKETILASINELELHKSVIVSDGVPYNKIKQILADCRIGFITYLSYPNNMACLPNKMFEYMGAGVVTIASNFANYEEILVENKCGLVVTPEDYEEIAEATIRVIEDNSLAEELSKNARQAYVKRFNWETEEDAFIQVYRELLEDTKQYDVIASGNAGGVIK